LRRALFAAALVLTACTDGGPIPAEDLLLRITADATEVESGIAFPLTVVRVWNKDLTPTAWDEAALAPLVLRVEETARREDGERVEETRRYRAYAFGAGDVSIPGPLMTATPRAGGPEQTVAGDPVQVRVTPAVDPDDPGPIEWPGEPLREPFPWTPLAGGVALALVAVVLAVRRRRPVSEPEPGEPAAPEVARPAPGAVALDRLRLLRARDVKDDDAVQALHEDVAVVLRDYVGERCDWPAVYETTEEFVAASAVIRALGAEQTDALRRLLVSCDLVKFARVLPDAADRSGLLDGAEGFVGEGTP
jgi:hypothetical protein